MIRNILLIFLINIVNLFNNPQTNEPVRLQKQQTKYDIRKNLDSFISKNFSFIALAGIIFLIVFFVCFCFWVTGLSATESGMMYNHLDKVI